MQDKFLRINDVIEMLSVGKSTIWAWVKQGKFPPPIKLSPGCTVWSLNTIDEWVNQKKGNQDWINNQILD